MVGVSAPNGPAGRLQPGQQRIAVAPGSLSLGGGPARRYPLGPVGGGGQADRLQHRPAGIVTGAIHRGQPLGDGLEGRLVAVFP
jgi:hypothetical protein